MALQIIEAISTPSTFQFDGDTAELRLYCTLPFVTSNGQLIGQGTPIDNNSWYLSVQCEVQPTNILYVPSFQIDSTTDGQPRLAKYIAALFTADGAYIGPMPTTNPAGFRIPPPSLMPNPTWGQLAIYNKLPTLVYPPTTFPTSDLMYAAIAAAIGQQDNASSTNKGVTALTTDPFDPTFPIAVSASDPDWLALIGGEPDASTTVKGITKLSVAPVLASNPIAVGDNDPRLLSGHLVVASTTCVLDSNVITGGGTDDTAALQALLDIAQTEPLYLIMDGAALTGPLNIYGNTTIFCVNQSCGFYLANGSDRALLRNANPSTSTVTDEDIWLIGGSYNGNGTNQTGVGSFGTQEANGTLIGLIQMYGVIGLKIHSVTCIKSKTIAIHLSNVQNFDIRDIFFDQATTIQQGGLQIEGLCSIGTINGLRGSTWDDFLAFSSDGANWPNPPFTGLGPYVVAGAVTDITASNLDATTAFGAVRLFNGVNLIDRVRVSNITGAFENLVSNDPSGMALTGNIGTVTIDGAIVTHKPTATQPLINLFGKIRHLILRDVQLNDPLTSVPMLKVNVGGNIQLLDIDGFSAYDTSILSYQFIPMVIEGRILKLLARNLKWLRSPTLTYNISSDEAFILIQTATGGIQNLILDGLIMNKAAYGVYEVAGYMRTAMLSNVSIYDSPGGAALRVTGDDLIDVSISNWYGEMAPPYLGLNASPRKRGDVFPFDTTPPTFSSATVKGGQDVVTVVFSETVNAINAILGVTIKKNTVAQTIIAATGNVGSQAAIDFQLSAVVAPGDTVTWEYAAASGFITDWWGNVLANVAAQAVTNANTTRTFDRFDGASGSLLNGRTPSPTTTGGALWATLLGTASLQTITQSTRLAELASPFEAAGATTPLNSTVQSLVVESTFADVIITCDVMMTQVNGSAGVVFRETDANNFWLYWITPYATALYKVVAGSAVTISSVTNFHGLQLPYSLEVTLSGNNISGKVNGAETISTVDAFNSAATKHGIQGSQGENYFDNFLVVS